MTAEQLITGIVSKRSLQAEQVMLKSHILSKSVIRSLQCTTTDPWSRQYECVLESAMYVTVRYQVLDVLVPRFQCLLTVTNICWLSSSPPYESQTLLFLSLQQFLAHVFFSERFNTPYSFSNSTVAIMLFYFDSGGAAKSTFTVKQTRGGDLLSQVPSFSDKVSFSYARMPKAQYT